MGCICGCFGGYFNVFAGFVFENLCFLFVLYGSFLGVVCLDF